MSRHYHRGPDEPDDLEAEAPVEPDEDPPDPPDWLDDFGLVHL